MSREIFAMRRFFVVEQVKGDDSPIQIDPDFSSAQTLDYVMKPLLRSLQMPADSLNNYRAQFPTNHLGLSQDEASAIRIYTSSVIDGGKSIAEMVNHELSSSRSSASDWMKYTKYLMDSLAKLPPRSCVAYCFSEQEITLRPNKDKIIWREFTSCMSETAFQDQIDLLNTLPIKTIYKILCRYAKDVSSLAPQPELAEVLLVPGTQLTVINVTKKANGILWVELQESSPPMPLFSTAEKSQHYKAASATKNAASSSSSMSEALTDQNEKSYLNIQLSKTGPFPLPHKICEGKALAPINTVPKEMLNRIEGSIVGMAIGDALGAHVEFRPRNYLEQYPVKDFQGGGTWNLKPGQFTDDTSMALCLGVSLIYCHDFNPYDQLVRYKWWFQRGYMSSTGHCFDIGVATRDSLVTFEKRQREFAEREKIPMDKIDYECDFKRLKSFNLFCSSPGVAGNGALMRLAPVPLFFYRHPSYAVAFSGRSGVITHGDVKADDACRYYGALIIAALNNYRKQDILDDTFYEKHQEWFNGRPLCSEIKTISEGSYKKSGGYKEGIRGKGYIVNALEAALWAFWSTESYEEGALRAVNLGDDTDTTAAIFGQLAGAYYGYDKLPEKWKNRVYANNFLRFLSQWIAYDGANWKPENSMYKDILESDAQKTISNFQSFPITHQLPGYQTYTPATSTYHTGYRPHSNVGNLNITPGFTGGFTPGGRMDQMNYGAERFDARTFTSSVPRYGLNINTNLSPRSPSSSAQAYHSRYGTEFLNSPSSSISRYGNIATQPGYTNSSGMFSNATSSVRLDAANQSQSNPNPNSRRQ